MPFFLTYIFIYIFHFSSVSATSATLEAGPSTPLTPTSLDIGGTRFGPSTNTTDVGANRYPIPSPHTPGGESKPPTSQPTVPTSQSLTGTSQPTGPPTSTGSVPSTCQSTGQPPQPQNNGPPPPTPGSGPNTPSGQPRYPGPVSAPGAPPLVKTPNADVGSRFLTSSPQLTPEGMGPPRFPSQGSGPIPPPLSNPNFMNQPKVGPGPLFMDSPSSGPSSPYTPRADNVPLNPGIPCNGKGAHFDPITSMAQMSQQLTSQVANSPGGSQPPGGMGMMPFNAGGMHPMQMNDMGMPPMPPMTEPTQGPPQMQFNSVNNTAGPGMNQQPMCSVSPKPCNMMMGMVPPRVQVPGQYPGNPMPQRMLGRPAGPNPYNGANVQVKASAPNTIQYLPAKPQPGSSGPRAPPSLDFLQRFTNPLSNLDSKVPTHNLQYFPNGGQPNPGMPPMNMPMNRPNGMMGPVVSCGTHPGHPGNPVNGPMMGMGMGGHGNMVMSAGPGMGMAPMRGGLRPGPPGPGASVGMMRMQPMPGHPPGGPPGMFGGMSGSPNQPGGPPESMYIPGPNMGPSVPGNLSGPPTGPQPPQQLFVPGSKSSPMGLGAPDASQPLPPSMSQTTNFKNSPFIGPTTADPNYAQQFHNFQQQLYATNTRSQLNNQQNPQQMGPNPNFFVSK